LIKIKLRKNNKKKYRIETIGNFGDANLQKSCVQVYRHKILCIVFLAVTLLLLIRCANPVTPEGGKKDTSPPSVVACDPPNHTIRFSENSFTLQFDEFITLKNQATEVYFSPPLKTIPDFRLRGKSLVVKFDDTLVPGVTYSVNFGKAIADLTEGTPLSEFSYVFSTGDYIDSLSLRGNVVSAFNLQPQKDVFVGLYLNNNDTLHLDSMPLHVLPYYLSKTDENGIFRFSNLQNQPYKVFAIADQNGDLIFNQPSEKIAFSDSLVSPYFFAKPVVAPGVRDSIDSLKRSITLLSIKVTDSIRHADSTRRADSISQNLKLYPPCSLFLYEETDSIQRLLKADFIKSGEILLLFRFPVKSLRVVPLSFDSTHPWCLKEYSSKKDSVTLWLTKPGSDTLKILVDADTTVMDTLTLELTKKTSTKKPQAPDKSESLSVTPAFKSSSFNQFRDDLQLVCSYPLIRWDLSGILLISDKDTIHPGIRLAVTLHRRLILTHKWEEEKRYRILIPDSAFTAIQNKSHDTIRIEFSTKAEKDFGNLSLSLNFEKSEGSYIIQLWNENESAIAGEMYTQGTGKMTFSYLLPGKYKIKAIVDRNKNGRWDSGRYRQKMQPEKVFYYPKTIEIRSNWDDDETWDYSAEH